MICNFCKGHVVWKGKPPHEMYKHCLRCGKDNVITCEELMEEENEDND